MVENIFSRAVARALADGGRQANIVIAGHSHVAGEGATSDRHNAMLYGFPAQLVTKLATLGTQAECANIFGDFNATAFSISPAYMDPRLTLGSGWAPDGIPTTLGARFITQAAGGTGELSYTPDTPFTAVRFFYPTASGLSTGVEVKVDGVLRATVVQDGSLGFQAIDVPFGGTTVSIKNAGAGTGFFIGFQFSHAAPLARIMLGAFMGANAGDYIDSNPWSAGHVIDALFPDVGVFYCMTNDINNGAPKAEWKGRAKSVIQRMQVTGEAVLVIDPPALGWTTNYQEYADAAYEIQSETGCAILDLKASFVSYANSVSNGWQYDAYHPNFAGYTKIANELAALP